MVEAGGAVNLLFTLDENYIPPLKVLLFSVFQYNPEEKFTIFLMHTNIREESIEDLCSFIEGRGHEFHSIQCRDLLPEGDETKISRYYSIEMYYWLFAPFLLPETIDRILYLDPDIVCKQSFKEFYEQPFDGQLFVASSHQYLTKWLKPINHLRLNTEDLEGYFNSGVVLMDLEAIREESSMEHTISEIEDSHLLMWLPDQDVFNRMYAGKIKEADWRLYNLGPRIYEQMQFFFPNKYDEGWAEKHVVFIHYYGKKKPWKERERYGYSLGSYFFDMETRLNELKERGMERDGTI